MLEKIVYAGKRVLLGSVLAGAIACVGGCDSSVLNRGMSSAEKENRLGDILFASSQPGKKEGLFNLVYIGKDGGNRVELDVQATLSEIEDFRSAFSPEGKIICFLDDTTLFVTDSSGKGARKKVSEDIPRYKNGAMWDSNGSRLVFLALGEEGKSNNGIRFRNEDVFVWNREDGVVKNLTNSIEIQEYSPCFSASGKEVFYCAGRDIYSLEIGSPKNVRKITEGEYPFPTPDGKSIVFTNNGRVILKFLENGLEKVLTGEFNAYCSEPIVSPDGKYVAFSYITRTFGPDNLAVVNLKTYELKKLTENEFENTSHSWSPNSKSLVYVSIIKDRGFSDIYSVDIESGKSSVKQLTYTKDRHELIPIFHPGSD
jgi:Tol biopolymer transport system component